MTAANNWGSDAHLPRQIRLPSCRIEIAVSFMDTSRPIYCSMAVLRSMPGPGVNREPVLHPTGGQPTSQMSKYHHPNSRGHRSRDYVMFVLRPQHAEQSRARHRIRALDLRSVAGIELKGSTQRACGHYQCPVAVR